MAAKRPYGGSPERLAAERQKPRSEAVTRCVEQITDAIRTRRYLPEQRLGEATLAEELGCGKAQVRAALDQLAHVGIVERRPRSGTYIRSLTVRNHIELAEVRAVLEGFAARAACATPDHLRLSELRDCAERLDQAMHDDGEPWDRLMELETDFHSRMAAAGNNEALMEIVAHHNFLARHLSEAKLVKMPTLVYFGTDMPPHRRIVDALASGNLDDAEHEARNHVLVSLFVSVKLFLRLSDDNGALEDRHFAAEWLKRATKIIKPRLTNP